MGDRVVPTTWWPASRSSGASRRPMAPVAPAKNMCMVDTPFAAATTAKGALAPSERLHQLGSRRSFGSDVDREQSRRLHVASVARDPMNCARRFPPGIPGVEYALGLLADL